MLIVTRTIDARADTFDELRALSLGHVARSRAELGCLEHGVTIDANDGLRIIFFERWADGPALGRAFQGAGIAGVRREGRGARGAFSATSTTGRRG